MVLHYNDAVPQKLDYRTPQTPPDPKPPRLWPPISAWMLGLAIGASFLSLRVNHLELLVLNAAALFAVGGIVIGVIVALIDPSRGMNLLCISGCAAWIGVMYLVRDWRYGCMLFQ